jgi:hypothetical protein
VILAAEWMVAKYGIERVGLLTLSFGVPGSGNPARLTAEQVAWVLNCQPHDAPVLVAAKLLKPLGNPPSNSFKFYCSLEVLELLKDRSWLARMTNALNQHWKMKNSAKCHSAKSDLAG